MEPERDGRLTALDGLRGVAALVVVLFHVVKLSVVALGTEAEIGGTAPGLAGRLSHSPLAILWAGPEFVMVFFVLSGFVLARALHGRPVRLASYYAARALRLYLPVWGSLVLAGVLVALVPRAPSLAGANVAVAAFAAPVDRALVLHNALLVTTDARAPLNGVLWSLRWEVLFSLLLPVLLLGAGLLRRAPAVVVALVVLGILHPGGHASLSYLTPFVLGVLLALHPDAVARVRARVAGRGAPVAVLAAVLLLTADRWLPDAQRDVGPGGALVALGAMLAVAAPLVWPAIARPLQTPPIQWLGRRSFSLYLTHEPLVVALFFALHRPGLPVLLAAGLPASLLLAAAFHRAVERPAHLLARRAGAAQGVRPLALQRQSA
jgi:peptidoglycan/LPS O-acetylase OafA/YrhL